MQVARVTAPATASLLVGRHDSSEWLAFVSRHPEATLFHHPAWLELLGASYGYEPSVITNRSQGEIVGGLPVLLVRSRLTGNRFVSLPFSDHVRVLVADQDAFIDFGSRLRAWAELQSEGPLKVHSSLPHAVGARVEPVGVIHRLPLGRSADSVWRLLPAPVRRAIGKAERNGVTIRHGLDLEDVETFYELHCATRQRQGVPVQPWRFFAGLAERITQPGLGFVSIAEHRGRAIAAAIFLDWNRALIYKYAASDPSHWDLRPNNLVIWSAIQLTSHRVGHLDFGKTDSDNIGLRAFKLRWGAEESLLEYSTLNDPRHRGPERPSLIKPALAALIRTAPRVAGRMLGEQLYGHFG